MKDERNKRQARAEYLLTLLFFLEKRLRLFCLLALLDVAVLKLTPIR